MCQINGNADNFDICQANQMKAQVPQNISHNRSQNDNGHTYGGVYSGLEPANGTFSFPHF